MITIQYESAPNKSVLIFQLLLPLLLLLILPLVLILVLILSSNTLLATTQIYTIQELPFFDKEFYQEFDKNKFQVNESDVCYLDFTKKALSKINREMSKEGNKAMNKDINAAIDDAEMNAGLNDEEMDKILNKVLNKSLLEQISDNLQCRFRAASSGITKVPAVVIDDKVVVYGARSIKQAYDLYALKERANNG